MTPRKKFTAPGHSCQVIRYTQVDGGIVVRRQDGSPRAGGHEQNGTDDSKVGKIEVPAEDAVFCRGTSGGESSHGGGGCRGIDGGDGTPRRCGEKSVRRTAKIPLQLLFAESINDEIDDIFRGEGDFRGKLVEPGMGAAAPARMDYG